jgi:hypothetical protein
MNSTYSVYAELVMILNILPLADETPDPHLKHMVISKRLDSAIYILKFRIYLTPVFSDDLHLHYQAIEVLFRRLKILERLLICDSFLVMTCKLTSNRASWDGRWLTVSLAYEDHRHDRTNDRNIFPGRCLRPGFLLTFDDLRSFSLDSFESF